MILSEVFPPIIELTVDDTKFLVNLANQITHSPSDEPDLFFEEVKRLSTHVPPKIAGRLAHFLYGGDKHTVQSNMGGYLLIRTEIESVDIEIPNTPNSNGECIGEKTTLARIQAILMAVIGEMVAYEAEGYGRLFQDVIPIKQMETIQTSVGSNTELEIHTEQAFSELRPDILSLACLRGTWMHTPIFYRFAR